MKLTDLLNPSLMATNDHALKFVHSYAGNADIIGMVVEHQRPDNGIACQGVVTFGAAFPVLTWEPLTIFSAMSCPACGDIGTVINGEWRPPS